MMIVIDPNALYSLDELREMLDGMVKLDTFIDRLGLRNNRVFRDSVWGFEILEAAKQTDSFSQAAGSGEEFTVMARRGNSGREHCPDKAPVRKLSARDLGH